MRVPIPVQRAVGWSLDVVPTTRGRTPVWVLTAAGLALALLATTWQLSRMGTFVPWAPHPVVLDLTRQGFENLLAGGNARWAAIDISPVAVLFSAPLTLLTLHQAAFVVAVISAGAAVSVVRMLGIRGWAVGLVAAALVSTFAGHEVLPRGDPILLLLAVAMADIAVARHARTARWAGVLSGVVASCTPILALFMLPVLLARRTWRTLVAAGLGFVVPTLIAGAVNPRATWVFWRYHQLDRLVFRDGSLDHQPFVAVFTHQIGGSRAVAIACLLLVWALAAAVIVLAARRRDDHTMLAAAAAAGFVWAPWPVGSILLVVLFGVLFGNAPGRGSRLPALLLVLLVPLGIWDRLPEDVYHTSTAVTAWILVLIVWWLSLRLVELFEICALRPVGRVLTWPLALVPYVVALYYAGTFFYPQSNPWNPWSPVNPDFQVYVIAATNLANGVSPYATQDWPFLYPPIAAMLALPTVWWPTACKAVWIVLKVSALWLMLYRIGVRDWRGPVLAALVLSIVGVLKADIGMGNIQGLMIAMVFLDLAPGRTLFAVLAERFGWRWAEGRTRLIPQGVLTGFVAAIKIIPLLFLVLLVVRGRWRPVVWAVGTGAVMTLIGAVFAPRATLTFVGMLLHGDLNSDISGVGVNYVSLVIGLERFFGADASGIITLISYAIGFVGFFAAWRWHRAGREWIGLSLCGIATIYFSPVAWNYYYVWLLPALLIVVRQLARDTPMPRWIQFAIIVTFGWATFEYHLTMPNGPLPDGTESEDHYTLAQRLVAGMMPFSGAILLGLAAVLGRRRVAPTAAGPVADDPEEPPASSAESPVSSTD